METTFLTNSPKAIYSPIIKAGFLSKKGGERRNWNKRWFELRSHSLAYYNSRKADKLKGEIPLINCEVEEQEYETKTFVFVLKSSNRTYFISAFSEADMKSWIKSITKCIQSLELETNELTKPLSMSSNNITFNSPVSILQRSLSSKNIWPKKSNSQLTTSADHGTKVSSLLRSFRTENSAETNKNISTESSPICITKFELPNDLQQYSREQLVELISNLFLEQQKNTNELQILKQKSAEVVTSLKTQLLSLYSENKQIQKDLLLKDANIRKMQFKIVEANQRVVDAIPLQETTGLFIYFDQIYYLNF